MTQHHPDHLSVYQHHLQKTQTTHQHHPPLHNQPQHASGSNHHPYHRTNMQTGMLGTATPTVAWSNSKKTLDFVPAGPLWLAEWVSQSTNAKPDGKNSKTCSVSKTSNCPPPHYQQNHQDQHPLLHQHPPHQQSPQHHIRNRIFPLPPIQHHRLHHIEHLPLLSRRRRPLNLVRTAIWRNLHLRPLAVISFDPFHPAFSTACRRTNSLTCTDT